MDQVNIHSAEPERTVWQGEAFEVRGPRRIKAPFVFASPHSGREYPAPFLAASNLDALTIRRSEDSYVDELFSGVPDAGVPLLRAFFPRAYVDVNREPFELDPEMFTGRLPAFVNSRSMRVAGGLGTVARIVADGKEIYREKLNFAEVEQRIRELYEPYHDRLRGLVADAHHKFGCAVLIDCHSMPSVGGPTDQDAGRVRADVVLGDRHGTSCASALTTRVAEAFKAHGYSVQRNTPYAGAYTTERYGKPLHGIHALQIELNRALYMNEMTLKRHDRFAQLQKDLTQISAQICQMDPDPLLPVL